MSENNEKKILKKPSGKTVIWIAVILLLAILAYLTISRNLIGGLTGGSKVEFVQLAKDEIPQTIEKDVIPEYRDLERALGCLVDGQVYVVVTRGEKPTAGYDLEIDSIELEKSQEGSNMVVHATFTEPPAGIAVAQIITYPYEVAKTELTVLPDTIELMTKYQEGQPEKSN